MAYIVSKASQDIEYCDWVKGRNGLYTKKMSVTIKGGANVLNKKTMDTPNGVVTEVTAEELKFLESNTAFKRHKDRGFMVLPIRYDGNISVETNGGLLINGNNFFNYNQDADKTSKPYFLIDSASSTCIRVKISAELSATMILFRKSCIETFCSI